MKIAFVGCGYVFDIYMRTRWAYPELPIAGVFDLDTARSATVSAHYGLAVYESYDALLADPEVDIVVNLTSIASHYDSVRRALEAGKHVYSEKPLTTDLDSSRQLFDLARERGLVLAGAPSNVFSDAVGTVWKALLDGAVGKPVLVLAELDDNPAHLMQLEHVTSPTGAPFPYAEELQEGCTVEHVAYHLAWICAIFGPALSVTAFSTTLVAKKVEETLSPPDTADYSVALLTFANGVTARVTCSWVAPRDHSFRVIGDEGQIRVDNVFHDQSPVHLERFSRVSLAGRKLYTLRTQPVLGRLLNVGGRRLSLVRRWKSHAVEAERGVGTSSKHKIVSWLRRREVYAQDKLLGVAEMERAVRLGQPQPLPAEFLLHLNELTLLIHRAGDRGAQSAPTTTFEPIGLPSDLTDLTVNYRNSYNPKLIERLVARQVSAVHRR